MDNSSHLTKPEGPNQSSDVPRLIGAVEELPTICLNFFGRTAILPRVYCTPLRTTQKPQLATLTSDAWLPPFPYWRANRIWPRRTFSLPERTVTVDAEDLAGGR
jgi:hypothetical protein